MGKAILHTSSFGRSRRVTILSGHDRTFWGSRWFSLLAAIHGVWYVIRTQPNAQIELAAMTVTAGVGLWLGIHAWEWAILGLTSFAVLAMEAMNTAVESVVDLASPEYHPLAKIAKDAAAGAMIFVVLGSISVALAIFGPRLWELFLGAYPG